MGPDNKSSSKLTSVDMKGENGVNELIVDTFECYVGHSWLTSSVGQSAPTMTGPELL